MLLYQTRQRRLLLKALRLSMLLAKVGQHPVDILSCRLSLVVVRAWCQDRPLRNLEETRILLLMCLV